MAVDITPPQKAVDAEPRAGNGRFLIADTAPDDVFTREDLSEEQLLFGRAAEEFMRTEVLPRVKELYEHDWVLTRECSLASRLDRLFPQEHMRDCERTSG